MDCTPEQSGVLQKRHIEAIRGGSNFLGSRYRSASGREVIRYLIRGVKGGELVRWRRNKGYWHEDVTPITREAAIAPVSVMIGMDRGSVIYLLSHEKPV